LSYSFFCLFDATHCFALLLTYHPDYYFSALPTHLVSIIFSKTEVTQNISPVKKSLL